MNISISEYSFYHYVFPERDASFVLRFAGMFILLTVHVDRRADELPTTPIVSPILITSLLVLYPFVLEVEECHGFRYSPVIFPSSWIMVLFKALLSVVMVLKTSLILDIWVLVSS